MAKKKAQLDKSRAYACISSLTPGAAYEQDGLLFGSDEIQCGEVEGYAERQKAVADKAKAEIEAAEKEAAAKNAESILGDLGDPQAESLAENAAAAAAEEAAAEE
jgi:hypothetical protein